MTPRYPNLNETINIANINLSKEVPNAALWMTSVGCGITWMSVLYGSSPKEIVDKVTIRRAPTDRPTPEAFVIFSDVAEGSPGAKLAQYIEENKIGSIVGTSAVKNPNSHNLVKVWTWAPPYDPEIGFKQDGHVRAFGRDGRFKCTIREDKATTQQYQDMGYILKE